MNPIETLKAEHRLILKVLDALENYATKVQFGVTVKNGDLEHFVAFIRQFADACHHGKEEDILFAAMVDNGFPRDRGPIAVMLAEHAEARRLVGILAIMAEKADAWSDDDRAMITKSALAYVQLLRQHIRKEDNVLYPGAEANLPPEVIKQIGDKFAKLDQEETGPGEHERLHALADSLIARYAK
jgi:hemerythrin-like domain-containing protein